ncbi:signal peptide protein [Thioclava dalianensis]|uniref:Signal peptide protein n=1 Tax=Thioclava dalianensis TaxID=1185766 RepID=A0A074TD18_9RHOB|nr:hypothetical protein [Thioclava dalianensis]KEP68070.1 signal peptide protein [Thioclava dalianensis]SFM90487.1 hypothetical protein SAMN05216224_101827 [Thioclava dalianensis]
MRVAPLILALSLSATGAMAAPPAYLDNRSTPTDVVSSLYNALELHQYARAWSYFSESYQKGQYDDFVHGYASTSDVHVQIGKVQSEGAAGSIYTTVPVTVDSTLDNGKTQHFAGCYLVRQVQPGIQEPPFQPIHIENGHLVKRAHAGDMPSCSDDAKPSF